MIAGIHITKSVLWRGAQEEFENVYHYDTPSGLNTDAGWNDLVDAIVAIEKLFHANNVTWRQARVHGPTNTTQAEDVMRFVKDLSGTGAISGGTLMPFEMTIVAQLYMGRSGAPYHRKTFLRKYFHVCRLTPAGSGDDALGNTALSTAQKDFYKGHMNSLKTITIGGFANDLCKPNGNHIPLATDAVILNYAHTRQFRR